MRLLRRATSILVAFTLVLAPSVASAEGDAGAHFERGVAFFKDADYTAAMVEFKKAYELDPNYRGLYNLGQTSRELRDYAAALVTFERYLAEGGDGIKAERRKEVEGWVAELRPKVATVTVKTSVADAEVAVDDIAIGRTPLAAPVVMNAGRRKVAVVKSGYAPLTRFVDVAGTETKVLELELVALTVEGPSRPTEGPTGPGSAPPPPETSVNPAPWIMLGITAATGITAGILGGVALGKKSDFDELLTTFPGDPTAIDEARSDARTFAIGADAMTGVAAACGVTTIILFITDATGGGDAAPTDAPSPEVSARFGPGYVGLSGTF